MLLTPLSVVISAAENTCSRLDWAVADGAEQGTCSGGMFSQGSLCPAVAAVTSLVFVLGGEPDLPPQAVSSDQVTARSRLLTTV